MYGVALALALPEDRALGRPHERPQHNVSARGPEGVELFCEILHEPCCPRVIVAHLVYHLLANHIHAVAQFASRCAYKGRSQKSEP